MPAISTYRITRRDTPTWTWHIEERDALHAWMQFRSRHLGTSAYGKGRNPRRLYQVRRVA